MPLKLTQSYWKANEVLRELVSNSNEFVAT